MALIDYNLVTRRTGPPSRQNSEELVTCVSDVEEMSVHAGLDVWAQV